MKMKICAACLILWIGISSHVFADTHDVQKQLQQNLVAAQDEVKQLKTEIKVIQSYQESFLTTVYWALGTIATLAALLVGFGWFANFRIYERDKISLKQELSLRLNEEVQRLQRIVEKHVADSAKSIAKQVEKSTQESVTPLRKLIESNKQEEARQLASLERGLCYIERENWEKQGVKVNVLRTSIRILEISLRVSKYFVPDALDLVQSDLRKMVGTKDRNLLPDAHMLGKLNQALSNVSSEHAITVSAIRDDISKLQSF